MLALPMWFTLKYDELLSKFAFSFNLRPSTEVMAYVAADAEEAEETAKAGRCRLTPA